MIEESLTSGLYTIPADKLIDCTLAKPPEPIGYWILYPQTAYSHTVFAMYYKPTPEQIKNTEELLGWGWKDAP
jgi:hypothetical protein